MTHRLSRKLVLKGFCLKNKYIFFIFNAKIYMTHHEKARQSKGKHCGQTELSYRFRIASL